MPYLGEGGNRDCEGRIIDVNSYQVAGVVVVQKVCTPRLLIRPSRMNWDLEVVCSVAPVECPSQV